MDDKCFSAELQNLHVTGPCDAILVQFRHSVMLTPEQPGIGVTLRFSTRAVIFLLAISYFVTVERVWWPEYAHEHEQASEAFIRTGERRLLCSARPSTKL